MKEEDKIITIFSKNGITIKKQLDRSTPEAEYPFVIYSHCHTPSGVINQNHISKQKKITIKKESPLGFYYTKEITQYENQDNIYEQKDLSKDVITVIIKNIEPNYTFYISYLLSYHGTQVNIETRPWDLLDGDFPDNYLFGLLDDVNKLFDELESYKTSKGYIDPKRDWKGYNLESSNTVREIRRKVIKDLFGHPEGPKFQTNTEKIIAHGFDLKTSFRKCK